MKYKVFLLSVLFASLVIPNSAKAYDFSYTYMGQTLCYNIVNGEAQVTYQRTLAPRYQFDPNTQLIIPNIVTYNGNTYTVTSIGNNAFESCGNITSVTFGDSIRSIGSHAFYSCLGLTSLVIGNSVTTIGANAFTLCRNIESVVITNAVTDIGYSAFNTCDSLRHVSFGNSVTNIGSYAFACCGNLDSIVIPNTGCHINSYAFHQCSGLTYLDLDGVSYIGHCAFYDCDALTSVTIPSSVDTIYGSIFMSCNNITTVYYNAPNSYIFTNYGTYRPFHSCNRINTVIVGDNVQTIPESLFNYCDSLTTAIIGESVTSIGSYAFDRYDYAYTHDTLYVYMKPVMPPSSTGSFDNHCAFILSGCTAFDNYRNVSSSSSFYSSPLRYPADSLTISVTSSNNARGTAQIVQLYGHNVRCDSTAVISAMANSGYHFDHWSTGSTSNPDTLHLTSNTSITAYFVSNNATQYNLTVNSADPTMGSVSGGGTYSEDAAATLTATANSGYHFTHWQDGNTQNPRTIIVSSNTTYTAYFEADDFGTTCVITQFPYTMNFDNDTIATCWETYDGDGDGMSWFLNGNHGVGGTGCMAVIYNNSGANDDYLYSPWILTPGSYTISWKACAMSSNYPETYSVYYMSDSLLFSETISSTSYMTRSAQFTVNAGDSAYITFHYTSNDMYYLFIDDIVITQNITAYTLTVNSANPSMGSVSGGGTYNANATATLTATANDGYHFTHWQDNNTQNPRIVTVTANATYTAYFEQDATDPCTITTLPYAESFEGSMDCWTIVDANNDNNTWVVSNSFGEGSGVVNPHSGSKMAASFSWNTNPFNANEYLISPAIVLPSSNISLSWWYRVNGEYPADKLAVKVSTTTNATSSFTNTLIDITPTAANNNWTLQTVDLSAFAGQTIYIAFHHHDTYDNNYICIDDITISQGTTPTQYTITVNSANSSMGSVSGGGTYNSGSTATLTAIANSGYRFDHWQDNNTQNPRTITVTGNATYTAYFVATQDIDDVIADAVNIYTHGGQIVVETELKEEIVIYDIVGRKVDGGRNTRFDVPASGVYLVKIGTLPTQKVVVVK